MEKELEVEPNASRHTSHVTRRTSHVTGYPTSPQALLPFRQGQVNQCAVVRQCRAFSIPSLYLFFIFAPLQGHRGHTDRPPQLQQAACRAAVRPSTHMHQDCSSLLNAPGCRYRLHVTETVANGLVETVRPYLIDLETTNGLFSPALSFARQTVAVLTRRCPAELRSSISRRLQALTSNLAPRGSALTSRATTK